MFSSRLRQTAGRNRLALALDTRRAAGLPIDRPHPLEPDARRILVSCRPPSAPCRRAGALLRPRTVRAPVGPAGRVGRLCAARCRGVTQPDRADGQHERSVFPSLQAPVRSRRRRARTATELSADRASCRSRCRIPRTLQPRVPWSVDDRCRWAAGETVGKGERTGARHHHDQSEQSDRFSGEAGRARRDCVTGVRARPCDHLRRSVCRLPDRWWSAWQPAEAGGRADICAGRPVQVGRPSSGKARLDCASAARTGWPRRRWSGSKPFAMPISRSRRPFRSRRQSC